MAASGLTREAYQLDPRQYLEWCTRRGVGLFEARRADIEGFGRHLETVGRARATIAIVCVRSRVSTDTPNKKGSFGCRPPCTCGDRASITNHTPSGSTATKSARSS